MRKKAMVAFIAVTIMCVTLIAAVLVFDDDHDDGLPMYEWEYNEKTFELSIGLDEAEKEFYDSIDVIRTPFEDPAERGRNIMDFIVSGDDSKEEWDSSVYGISMRLKELYDKHAPNHSDQGLSNFVLSFIQSNFEYVLDIELYRSLDYIAFPAQTIHRQSGDCEDLSVLYSSIMSNLGYDTGVIVFSDHVISAIRMDSFQTTEHAGLYLCYKEVRNDDRNYLVYGCETTPGPFQPAGYIYNDLESEQGILYMREI